MKKKMIAALILGALMVALSGCAETAPSDSTAPNASELSTGEGVSELDTRP